MNNNKKLAKNFFISLLVLGVASITTSTFAKKAEPTEKCMGIAKAGKGDGKVKVDGKIEEWLTVPAGACAKLMGGRVYISRK